MGPPAVRRADPLVSSQGGESAIPRLAIRPSASEPALPEEERGPVERHRAADLEEEPPCLLGQDQACREPRTTEPAHSMSERGHSMSAEPAAVHNKLEPVRRTWEPVLRSHSRRNRHSRRCSHIRRSGDGGNGGDDSNHRNRRSRYSRRSRHSRTVPTPYPGRQ
jgi:hypothetical protein